MAGEQKLLGRISIETDDEALLAVLHFIPDENGIEIDAQSVNRLIAENKITYGFDRKELEQKIEKLLESNEEISITIAEGDHAEPLVPEEREWSELKIPEGLEEDVERFLKNAAAPEIWNTEIEKVPVEKTVKKKGILPFAKDKTETVKDLVKKEKKVRVNVIPDVIAAGWAEKEDKLADIIAAKPGKLGKDVYGKPIVPLSQEDEFWLGTNTEKKGSSIIATETGIVRRGWNWIEVIPFKSHDWNLELSKDKNTCLLNFNPGGEEVSLPDPAEIIKRAEMLGCPESALVGAEKINQIISTAAVAGKVLKNVIISSDDDGYFRIEVSDNRLVAEMVMHKGRGAGKPLVLKEAGSAIKNSGLKGMDLKKIQEVILDFQKSAEKDIRFILCEGTAPEEGEGGSVEYELQLLSDAAVDDIKKRAGGMDSAAFKDIPSAADYHPKEISGAANVKKDQNLASVLSSSGKKGADVFGDEIETSAKGAVIESLENVRFEKGMYISEIDGLLECFDSEGKTILRVRSHRDAEIEVKVAADKMTATLSIEPAAGTGIPPSLEEVNRQIAEAGLKSGINIDLVKSAVEKARNGESVGGALFAMGKAPKNAGEYKLKFLAEMADGNKVSIDEKGKANYRSQNRITNVKKGEILAEIQVIQGESEDGWDVLGNTLPAKQLTPLNVEIGANVIEEKDEEGNTFLMAEKGGRLIYENNKIEIQEGFFVKGDVDFSVGNIKFSGDVQVKGTVKNGFYIMAGGNVNIGMNSEMSLLSSEKTITVNQGIKGGGKALLRAKDSIRVSFAERATLLAVEDIIVKNAVFGCKVKCNGKLRLMTEKGYLVGGKIQARKGIEAANIGSLSGTRTEISFGQDYLIADQIEIEEKEITKIKNRLVKLDPEMRNCEKEKDSQGLNRLRQEKVKLMKIMEKRGVRIFTLKERFEQHFPSEIIIRGEVFPGVVFESHGRTLDITKKEKSIKIIFNEESGFLEKVPYNQQEDKQKEK